jgi:hypothetical protein
MSARPPAVRAAIQDRDMALFDFSFRDILRGTAVDLLLGMLSRPEAVTPA